MTVTRAQISIGMDSGIPADAVTNTLYFESTGDFLAGADLTAVQGAITTYVQAIDGLMPTSTVGPTATVKLYRMEDSTPRVPFHEFSITLTPGAGDALPSECAIVVSFQGSKASGINQARRRGRNYVGPLTVTTNAGGRPTPAAITTIRDAAAALLAASVAAAGWSWVVWSPTSVAAVPVASGWVDNAFDTQRRRGVDAITRSTF